MKRSRRIAVIVVAHAVEPLLPTDFPGRGGDLGSRFDDATSKSLMISLVMVILEILDNHTAQVVFTEEDHSVGDFALE